MIIVNKIFYLVGSHYGLHLTSYSQPCYRHTLVRRPSAVRWIPTRGHSSTRGRSQCGVPCKHFLKKKSRALLFLLEVYSSTLWLLQHKEKLSVTIIYTLRGFLFFQNTLYQQVRTVTWTSHSILFFKCLCLTVCALLSLRSQWPLLPIQILYILDICSHNT